jgi:hypothetical protein
MDCNRTKRKILSWRKKRYTRRGMCLPIDWGDRCSRWVGRETTMAGHSPGDCDDTVLMRNIHCT